MVIYAVTGMVYVDIIIYIYTQNIYIYTDGKYYNTNLFSLLYSTYIIILLSFDNKNWFYYNNCWQYYEGSKKIKIKIFIT